MEICVEKSTNEIVYAGEIFLTENGIQGPGFRDRQMTPDKCDIIEVDSIPIDFIGRGYTYQEGIWTLTNTGMENITRLIKLRKKNVQSRINDLFDAETEALKGNVTQGEINTFDKQEKQALAYQADNNAVVPLLSGLVAERGNGLTVEELANRVLAHAAAYEYAMGKIMGKKHRLEDQLSMAKTIEDLEKMEV